MEKIFLGIIQGITEFLPISSSGHLVLFNSFFQESNIDISTLTLLHLGTLGSILFLYRDEVIKIILQPINEKDTLIKILIGIVPAVLLGAFTNLSEIITNSVNILIYTGVAYIALSLFLYISKNIIEGEKRISNLTYLEALYIGIAQSIALMPGISRAGVTLIAALLIGLNKKEALLFSFLLGIPTIGGAWVFSLVSYGINYDLLSIVSTLFAFVFGILAIRILIKFTLDSNLYKFSLYTFALGLIAIIIN